MKMKNTTTNHCSSIDPLKTAVSTENSVTSELYKNVKNKKKKTFLSKVKAIFSKSSTEAQKKVPQHLTKEVKSTYVVRENQGASANDLQAFEDLNNDVDSDDSKIYYGAYVNLTQNQSINHVHAKNEKCDDLVNETFENMDSLYPTAANNSSWITSSTNTCRGTETNSRDIFTTTLPSSQVDVGVQTKIPSCYKLYLLRKHVSNCNRRNKSNSKIKNFIFMNTEKHKSPVDDKSYYNKYSSTQSISTDESDGEDKMRGEHNTKYWKEGMTKNNQVDSTNSTRYYERNNIDIEVLESVDGFPSEILNIDSNCNIIIDNAGKTTFLRALSCTSSSSFSDSTEIQKLEHKKANDKNSEIQTLVLYTREEANPEGSQSKSLPSLNLFRKKRSVNKFKCNSSPLVSQNKIQTFIVKKKESGKPNLVNILRNDKGIKTADLQAFGNCHRKKYKGLKETRKQFFCKTTSLHYEEVSSFQSNNSNVVNEMREKGEMNNLVKINEKRNQISEKQKTNKLKTKHIDSNSKIREDIWRKKRSVIRKDINTMKININTTKSKEHNLCQNDRLIYSNFDNVHQSFQPNHGHNDESNMKIYDKNDHFIFTKPESQKLNRRPIITQPMIFFNENIPKTKTENCIFNYVPNKSFYKKETKTRDVNMKFKKTIQQHIKCPNDCKTSLEPQNLNPYKINNNDPEMRSRQKFMDNATIHELKTKGKNHKEIKNFTLPLSTVNKQKFANVNKNKVNKPLYEETNSYVCVKEKPGKKNNSTFSKNQGPHCNPRLGSSEKTFNKKTKSNCTFWKTSSEILKRSNLTEISFECNIKNNIFHKNKQVNKKTQKNWNESFSRNNKSISDNKFKKDSKISNQEMKMVRNNDVEKFLLKEFSSNVGVHGNFSGNIASKRRTFFAKITPMHVNK